MAPAEGGETTGNAPAAALLRKAMGGGRGGGGVAMKPGRSAGAGGGDGGGGGRGSPASPYGSAGAGRGGGGTDTWQARLTDTVGHAREEYGVLPSHPLHRRSAELRR